MKHIAIHAPLKIAGLYAAFGFAWILLSDRAVGWLASAPEALAQVETLIRLQTWKGTVFVLISAALVFALARRTLAATGGRVEALHKSREHYRMLFTDNPQPMWSFDIETLAFLDINRAGLALLGCRRQEDLPAHVFEMLPPEERTRFDALVERYRGKNMRTAGRWRLRRPDGSVIVADIVSEPAELGGRPGRLVSATDVTAQVAAEAALEDATRRIERTGEEIRQLSQAAAHQLQAPLRTVVSHLQLLERRAGAELDPECRDFLRFAVEGALQMKLVVDDILQFTEIEPDDPAPTDLNEVLEEVKSALRPRLTAAQATIAAEPLPRVRARRRHMSMLLRHLLDNAIKFRRPGVPPVISLTATRSGGSWELRVTDNGPGIPPEHHLEVFGVFRRLADDAVPGTGIGLAVCKKIVEQHGGRIHVESDVGHGSSFVLSLPA